MCFGYMDSCPDAIRSNRRPRPASSMKWFSIFITIFSLLDISIWRGISFVRWSIPSRRFFTFFFFLYFDVLLWFLLGMDDDEHQFDDIPVVINGFYSDSERSNFFLLRWFREDDCAAIKLKRLCCVFKFIPIKICSSFIWIHFTCAARVFGISCVSEFGEF